MDRLCSGRLRGRHDPIDHEIAFTRGGWTDQHSIVGFAHMGRSRIRLGIDRDGSNTHLPCRSDDPAGDFTAIGDKE